MGRFFFDVKTPELLYDEDGTELPDLPAAVDEAQAAAQELARNAGEADCSREEWVIVVRDDSGVAQFELPVRNWLEIGASLQ